MKDERKYGKGGKNFTPVFILQQQQENKITHLVQDSVRRLGTSSKCATIAFI
jgi:hypothetical protein